MNKVNNYSIALVLYHQLYISRDPKTKIYTLGEGQTFLIFNGIFIPFYTSEDFTSYLMGRALRAHFKSTLESDPC